MRTVDQIINIKKQISDPYKVEDFLTIEEINHLISLYNNNCYNTGPYTTVKITGPVTVDLLPFRDDIVVKKILSNLKNLIGDYAVTAAFFFKTDYPHIIHNDDTFELPDNVYKAITVPLYLENFKGIYPKLCFFNQFYFHGPAKFFKGSENIPTYYNKQIYNYSDIDGLVDELFVDKNNYFTHLYPQWLEGLSLHSTLDWVPSRALIFDSVRLHCASDFRNLGIKSKLAISIFTKKC